MKRFLSAVALLLSLSLSLSAQDRDALIRRTQIARQGTTINGERGSFTVAGATTLNPGQFSFGAGWTNYDRTPKDIDVNSFPVHVSFGLFDGLTVSASGEVRKQVTARNLSQPGYNNGLPYVLTRYQEGYGDATVAVKYRLQRKEDNVGGLAIRGLVKFGTGKPDKGLGSGEHDYGAELLFSSLLPLKFVVHSSIGYLYTRNGTSPFDRTIKDQLQTGIGVLWPATGISMGGKLQGVFEYTSTTFVGCCAAANAATAKVQNPSDILAGVRYLLLGSGLTFDGGYRFNYRFDLDNINNKERNGLIAGVSFTQPNTRGLSTNRSPLVAVEASSTDVAVNGNVNLTATGFDADNNRLTYTWSATGGQVIGTGATAIYRGGTAGRQTVRVLVSDGNGGTASAEIAINVR